MDTSTREKQQRCRCGHLLAEHSCYGDRGCLADTGTDPNRPNPVPCQCDRYEPPHPLEREHVLACGHTVIAFPCQEIWCKTCRALVRTVEIKAL